MPQVQNKPAPRPTIRDVSRLSGVSRMTVSRALSQPERVLPATRDKVNRAIAALGYVPDRAAGGLASRRSGFIALVLPTLTNPNFATVARGLTEALYKHRYHLLIAYNNYSLSEEKSQIANLLARRPEAIVLTGATHRPAVVRMLARADIPVFEISDLPASPIQYAVGFSNHEVGRMAARYLLEHGFERIGALAGRCESDVGDYRGEARVRGFEAELRLHGRSTARVVRQGRAPLSFNHGSAAMARLLEQNPDVDAVFGVSDLSAVGAVMECQRRGVRVPDDVSVIGFGDFDIGREINPALTTIQVDFYGLGKRVGELLTERVLVDHDADVGTVDVGLNIIERGSVKGVEQ